jgi:hypothetical protein
LIGHLPRPSLLKAAYELPSEKTDLCVKKKYSPQNAGAVDKPSELITTGSKWGPLGQSETSLSLRSRLAASIFAGDKLGRMAPHRVQTVMYRNTQFRYPSFLLLHIGPGGTPQKGSGKFSLFPGQHGSQNRKVKRLIVFFHFHNSSYYFSLSLGYDYWEKGRPKPATLNLIKNRVHVMGTGTKIYTF